MSQLTLKEYRHLVALDEPFVTLAVERPDTDALLRVALDFLEQEHGQSNGPRTLPHLGDARRRLRALLTVRPPTSLPGAVQEAIDALLQLERTSRLLTDALDLARFELAETRASTQVALWKGDITTLAVDAIVNAANEQLLGCFSPFHACIDNAIHSAAGPRLREDCHRIMCAQGGLEPTATAKVTRAYNLPSKFVLHTVGPIVRGPLTRQHEEALAQCYRACLDLALETGRIRSLAFCGISTGVFGFPAEPAARIALHATRDWIRENPHALDLVVFDVFSDADETMYRNAIKELRS